jgi:hypothetical protein
MAPPGSTALPDTVEPHLVALLDELVPSAACVMNACLDVLAANAVFRALVLDPTSADGYGGNLLWHCFTDPEAQARTEDWALVAPHLIALFRVGQLNNPAVMRFKEITDALHAASHDFRDASKNYALRDSIGGFIQVHQHPKVGSVTTYGIQLMPADVSGGILFIMRGCTETDRENLRTLAAHRGDAR